MVLLEALASVARSGLRADDTAGYELRPTAYLHLTEEIRSLAQAATAQGIRSQRLPESLAFASGGPEI